MSGGSTYPDESSQPSVRTDPEGVQFWGTDRGVSEQPQGSASEPGVLAMNILPPVASARDAFTRASASAEYQLEHEPRAKYADELMEQLDYTLVPTAGLLDNDGSAVMTGGYDPYLTKEPKMRGTEQPSTGQIQANLASGPGQGLPSTEASLMSLLFDF